MNSDQMNLEQLLETPDDQRNEAWESQLLYQLPETKLKLLSPDPTQGPDGWPYLMAELTDEESGEPCERVLNWLHDKGIGLVINPKKEYPDAVITYGMAWSFSHRGSIKVETENQASEEIEITPGQTIYTREPDEKYLPKHARDILRKFLNEQGVPKPKFLLISTDQKHEDLVFSWDSLGQPPSEEHQGVLEAISWFLPMDYSLAMLEEQGLPDFFEL